MTDVVLVNAIVFDGTGARPCEAALRIRGSRITAVGPRDEIGGDGDDRVIDLAGKFVMPGMIDCHVHLTSSGAANYELQRLKELIPLQALRGAANAATILRAGFTTVRDLSAAGYANIAIRQAIDEGL